MGDVRSMSQYEDLPRSIESKIPELDQHVDNIENRIRWVEEKVRELKHNNNTDGNLWWDLRSYNNQEVAPGLYIYVVETPSGDKKIDKFAIVR